MMKKVDYNHLGVISYKEAWDLQESLMHTAIEKKIRNRDEISLEKELVKNKLLICRHPHVYTLGRHGHSENLLLNEKELREKGIEFFMTNRGGDITYHGPGQLVAYPVLDLEQFGSSIKIYLRSLEEVIIRTIAEYGLKGERIDGATGVWIDKETTSARKICAMGVRCSRWITIHGLALNMNTDLDYFNHIIPCGISDKGVTGMDKELGHSVNEKEVEEVFIHKFEEVFEVKIAETNLFNS